METMDDLKAGLYDGDFLALEEARRALADPALGAEVLRSRLALVVAAYEKLLGNTLKLHNVADRQYGRLVEMQEHLVAANVQLEKVSVTDRLTGLFNRHKMHEILEQEINRMARFGSRASLVMADVDHFKQVNDLCGHLEGDRVLARFAKILREGLRKTDFCARWGGEEFLVLLPETRQADALAIAEKLRLAIESDTDFSPGRVTASFGVSEHEPGWSAEAWLDDADKGLYRAKRGGRNRVDLAR